MSVSAAPRALPARCGVAIKGLINLVWSTMYYIRAFLVRSRPGSARLHARHAARVGPGRVERAADG